MGTSIAASRRDDNRICAFAEGFTHTIDQFSLDTIEVCHKAENIRTLMNIAHIEYDDTKIIEAFEEGVSTV